MRGEHTIEEQVEQLKEYLGCPCTYYPPSNDCQLMDSDFHQARARGKKEGFVPMLIAVDELLLECFAINGEDKSAKLMGEVSGGERIDRFLSIWDYNGKQTIPIVLAEIPVKNPWEVFAYLPFGGWNECPATKEHMAVAKYWFEKYGAVPALMTPDVLEYTIPFGTSVPSWQALDLALEQYAYCNDIVDQGVGTIGALADGLMKSHNWYFWWD